MRYLKVKLRYYPEKGTASKKELQEFESRNISGRDIITLLKENNYRNIWQISYSSKMPMA